MTSFLDSVEALLAAAKDNRIEFVSEILSKDRTFAIASNYDGFSALHVACAYGHTDLVELLLKNGANVYSRTVDGATPLCEACGGGWGHIAELLLAHGAQINPPCQLASALHEAAANGKTEVCKLLIAHGAKVNATDCWYGTPLHAACFRGQINAALALLNAGADVNARKIHSTPLHYAVEQQPESIMLSHLLISYGAKLNARNNQGLKPIDLLSETKESHKKLRHFLVFCEQNPQTLKELCKVRICDFYRSDRKIFLLPLPAKLKSYLTEIC